MDLYGRPIAPFPYWPNSPFLAGLADDAKRKVVIDQIGFIEAAVTRITRGDRVTMSFNVTGAMPEKKKARFIKRFVDPMLKHDLGRNLLADVNQGKHSVEIAWNNGGFGFNGTIARERAEASNGKGSRAVIFIDEEANDLKALPTLLDNPDVLLFHELLHARRIQRGTIVNDEEEMERQVIGIGKHTKDRQTENAYRDAKSLKRRCCWTREAL